MPRRTRLRGVTKELWKERLMLAPSGRSLRLGWESLTRYCRSSAWQLPGPFCSRRTPWLWGWLFAISIEADIWCYRQPAMCRRSDRGSWQCHSEMRRQWMRWWWNLMRRAPGCMAAGGSDGPEWGQRRYSTSAASAERQSRSASGSCTVPAFAFPRTADSAESFNSKTEGCSVGFRASGSWIDAPLPLAPPLVFDLKFPKEESFRNFMKISEKMRSFSILSRPTSNILQCWTLDTPWRPPGGIETCLEAGYEC